MNELTLLNDVMSVPHQLSLISYLALQLNLEDGVSTLSACMQK